MLNRGGFAVAACILSLGLAVGISAQQKWTYPNCPDVSSADFTKVVLVNKVKDPTLTEPVRMDFAADGRIFFGERTGRIKIFKPATPGAATGTIVTAATLDVYWQQNKNGSQSEMGIQGLVLDPNFATNNWIYLHYAPKVDSVWNVSRFTMTGDMLDMGSEKILLQVKVQRIACCHTGGAMEFDLKGNLWITMGNNTANPVDNSDPTSFINETAQGGIGDDQGHSANTNDYRGKILRIHPTADGKYTIPAGNLYPVGTEKTLPEIYSMGHRNAYTIALDKYRNWVAWGDIGPDEGMDTEEHNLITQPGFMGWPYFVGAVGNPNYAYRGGKNPAAPKNNSINNTGLVDLKPAVGAMLGYRQSAAMTGPIYYYDGANPSTVKWPPHFNQKWIISDWNIGGGYIKIVTMNENGTAVMDNRMLYPQQALVGPIDIKMGPDGALYTLEYGGTYFGTTGETRISRFEYKGTCRPALPVPPVSIGDHAGRKSIDRLISGLKVGADRMIAVPAHAKGFQVYDIQGKTVWSFANPGATASRIALPSVLGEGLYRVRFEY